MSPTIASSGPCPSSFGLGMILPRPPGLAAAAASLRPAGTTAASWHLGSARRRGPEREGLRAQRGAESGDLPPQPGQPGQCRHSRASRVSVATQPSYGPARSGVCSRACDGAAHCSPLRRTGRTPHCARGRAAHVAGRGASCRGTWHAARGTCDGTRHTRCLAGAWCGMVRHALLV
jgi:hypothetical protein